MSTPARLVTAMFARHGIRGDWQPLPSTGLANEIYATAEVVLRVATDHPEAIPDARTESVAAPAAHAAGIRTPRLIAFDDTRTVVDRPYSLWERVHAHTVGQMRLEGAAFARCWHDVGRELARLHQRVSACPDPQGLLDEPERERDPGSLLELLARGGGLDRADEQAIAAMIDDLQAPALAPVTPRLIHDDVHVMNLLCAPDGALRALIDWGDAGWGDPALDFAAMPPAARCFALEGYEAEHPGGLGETAFARLAWDALVAALEHALAHPPERVDRAAAEALLVRYRGQR